ncbi:unnamed protein product [Linum tenue]|uniref:Transmembrane protein n=1 Tax=Linum tenue TaxID=586396 RepID=A0AAV0LZM5_9ROSI|nr:unnamed protein product [Linum tenue]
MERHVYETPSTDFCGGVLPWRRRQNQSRAKIYTLYNLKGSSRAGKAGIDSFLVCVFLSLLVIVFNSQLHVDVMDEKTGPNVHSHGVEEGSAPPESNEYYSSGEVNMEAAISTDDVIRAGGFGARDDIGSLLPVASDSTDFEAMILNAKDYEGPQAEQRRPGLGWKDASEGEKSSSVP